MTTRYYFGDADDLASKTREEVDELTTDTMEDLYDRVEETINEISPEVKILDCTYTPGNVLREVDPIAFRQVALDQIADIDLDDYPSEDEYGPVCEVCEEPLDECQKALSLGEVNQLLCAEHLAEVEALES